MSDSTLFSWRAILAAPLAAPLAFAIWLGFLSPGLRAGELGEFLVVLLVACGISYGTTVFLFLPSLWFASRLTHTTAPLVPLLGGSWGGLLALGFLWISHKSSGPNSGPPEVGFLTYLASSIEDPGIWLFPLAGIATASLYHFLAKTAGSGTKGHA